MMFGDSPNITGSFYGARTVFPNYSNNTNGAISSTIYDDGVGSQTISNSGGAWGVNAFNIFVNATKSSSFYSGNFVQPKAIVVQYLIKF